MNTERYRHLDAGVALLFQIEDDNPEVLGWPESLRNSPYQQCSACKALDFEKLRRGQEHHQSWDAVKEAAVAGCHICRMLYFAKLHAMSKISSLIQSYTSGPVRLRLDGGQLDAGMLNGFGMLLRASILPSCPQDEALKVTESLTARFIEDDPGSEDAVATAKEWISHCTNEHPNCAQNDDVEMPSRVLDLSNYKATGRASLLTPSGMKSKYIALSHCWGGGTKDDGLLRSCTRANFDTLSRGFEVSMMPKNFRDAVFITQILGVRYGFSVVACGISAAIIFSNADPTRYLWIDSFCILQDSPHDWSRECERMSEVYSRSFLTIYASASANSDAGFLQRRTSGRYMSTKLCRIPGSSDHWVWARWPQTDQVWSTADQLGKLWTRAWAYQELLLPPRVLEYGPIQMHFRCNSQHLEECSRIRDQNVHDGYKELLWIFGPPEIADLTVLEHPRFATSSLMVGIYERWYQLVEGYAGRRLTMETDRLPAISGIAKKFQQATGDKYIAGLWKNDLAAGLCWGKRHLTFLQQTSAYTAPSWSWASKKGHIVYRSTENRKFRVDLVSCDVAADSFNPFGAVTRAALTIRVPMKRLHISAKIDRACGGPRIFALRGRNDGIASSQLPRGYRGSCAVSFDMELPGSLDEAFIALLAVEGRKVENPSDTLIPEGIVLEQIKEEDSIVYRRIGIWGMHDAVGQWMEESDYFALQEWGYQVITMI